MISRAFWSQIRAVVRYLTAVGRCVGSHFRLKCRGTIMLAHQFGGSYKPGSDKMCSLMPQAQAQHEVMIGCCAMQPYPHAVN